MKYIYILENEEKFRNEIIEAIRKVDPQIFIRYFESLEEFAKWIRVLMAEGSGALPKGGKAPGSQPEPGSGPHQLSLVISKNEFLGDKHMALLRKTRDLFIKKQVCTPEDPTSLVITSFESPDFDIKLVEDRIINNVIFKPFDKLILQQHLTFAIGGRHPASQYSVHNMKTTTTIEMLKEVEMEAISDVGFVSISNRPIAVGSVAKYYSPAFLSVKHRSMIALCVRCEPHPERADFYRCGFTYLAADSYQISNIRKEVRSKGHPAFHYEWKPQQHALTVHVALIARDEMLRQNFKYNLETTFKNVQVHLYESLVDFMYVVDPEAAKKDKKDLPPEHRANLPDHFHAVFAEHELFEENFKERWESILETIKKNMTKPLQSTSGVPEVFVLTTRNYSDKEERALGEVVKDIFFLPMDFLYVSKKISIFLPHLLSQEEIAVPTVAHRHTAKAATPIEISEFSEAGLVMKYYRPISTGAFREFVLWLPHELDLPEFLATCNYNEESQSTKGLFYNHFVFFGTKDHYLKHIRRWILQNHVASKESESA